MASIYTQKNSPYYWIRYYDILEHEPSRKRKSLNSKIPITPADQRRIEEAKKKGDKPELQGTPELKKRLREFKTGLAERNMQAKSGVKLIKRLNLSEIVKEYIINNPQLKKSSIEMYNYSVAKFIESQGDKQIHQYSKKHYFNFVEWMKQNIPNETSQSTLSKHLSVIFNYAKKNNYVIDTIVKILKAPPGIPEPIPQKDLEVILNFYRNKIQNLETSKVNFEKSDIEEQRLIVELMYYTGMRQSSILKLNWENISLDQRVIVVRNVKGKRDFIFPIHDRLFHLLEKIESKDGSLIKRTDTRLSFWDRDLKKLLKNKKIKKKYQMYQLRDTFASTCANAQIDISVVQDLLSHSNINITKNNYLLPEAERNRLLLNRVAFL